MRIFVTAALAATTSSIVVSSQATHRPRFFFDSTAEWEQHEIIQQQAKVQQLELRSLYMHTHKSIQQQTTLGALSVTPSILPSASSIVNVTVSWTQILNPNATTDWIGLFCSGYPVEDYWQYALTSTSSPSTFQDGYGNVSFVLIRSTCAFEFRFMRGKPPLWPSTEQVYMTNNASITWEGGSEGPYHYRLAYGATFPQTSMIVSWTSNSSDAQGVLLLGTASNNYNLPNVTVQDVSTYNVQDLCSAPANTTSVDYYQFVGYFHHAHVTGLTPNTVYYARPTQGSAVGVELSFKTAPALGPDVPIEFIAYGDQWLSADPGAIGTVERISQRLSAGEDTAFILHVGDLGYAKGNVALWDQWMSYVDAIADNKTNYHIPYMVSIGNHEYDYPHGKGYGVNDPSGAGDSFDPLWWDGLVDSLGECGVGTFQRFRAPTLHAGNSIFWYSFQAGSVYVITLSSEHDISVGSPQGDFLTEELANVNRSITPFLFVTLHRPVYQVQDDEPAVNEGIRAMIESRLLEANVDIVFSGHVHSYSRTCPLSNYTCVNSEMRSSHERSSLSSRLSKGNGKTTSNTAAPIYIVNGAAGAVFTDGGIASRWEGKTQAFNNTEYGISRFQIFNRTHLHGQWILNKDNSVVDDFWIIKE